MAIDPKSAIDAAKDIAAHAMERAADIVDDAGQIVKGDVAGGVGAIIQDSTEIASHAINKVKEVITGKSGE